MSSNFSSIRALTILALPIAILSFSPTGFAKKGGSGGGKPGGGDTQITNVALLMSASGRNNRTNIYALDEAGTAQQRLVSNASGFWGLAMPTVWSSQGDRIIWSQAESLSLHMVNEDGSDERIIVAADEHMHPWIGGQRNLAPAAYDCEGNSANLLYFLGAIIDDEWWHEEFYVMDLDNPSIPPVQLTSNKYERHTTLDVSPDGQFVATWTNDEPNDGWSSPASRLEIRDACDPGLPVVGSWTATELGQQPGFHYFARIDWSSSGLLAISGHNLEHSNDDIWLVDVDTTPVSATRIIGLNSGFGEGKDNRRVTWSPDGSMLAFSSDSEVYILELPSGMFRLLTDGGRIRDLEWRQTWVADP